MPWIWRNLSDFVPGVRTKQTVSNLRPPHFSDCASFSNGQNARMFHPDADLIACPTCDVLSPASIPQAGEKLRCPRCRAVLIAPRRHAGLKVMALALASLVLVWGAATMPFIRIRRFGLSNEATLLDVAFSFSGALLALAVVVLGMILVLPLIRAALSLYVLAPLVIGRPPLRHARRVFIWFEALRPWSMAEIFALGAGVAMIKIADLAHVTLGPAFWMFAGLVVVIIIQNSLMCRWSVWESLDA